MEINSGVSGFLPDWRVCEENLLPVEVVNRGLRVLAYEVEIDSKSFVFNCLSGMCHTHWPFILRFNHTFKSF
jgi:hypothetical protein